MGVAIQQTWTLTSSGGGTAVNTFGLGAGNYTVYYATDNASSGVVLKMQTAPTASGPWADVPGTSTSVASTTAGAFIQFFGPMQFVRPFCSSGQGNMTVQLTGSDNW